MYQIIRAYEAVSSIEGSAKTIETLKEWSQGGFFDSDILQKFSESLGESGALITVPSPARPALSHKEFKHQKERESRHYTPFVQLCSEILIATRKIEDLSHAGEIQERNDERKADFFKEAEELYVQLLAKADMTHHILVSRHGRAGSDIKG